MPEANDLSVISIRTDCRNATLQVDERLMDIMPEGMLPVEESLMLRMKGLRFQGDLALLDAEHLGSVRVMQLYDSNPVKPVGTRLYTLRATLDVATFLEWEDRELLIKRFSGETGRFQQVCAFALTKDWGISWNHLAEELFQAVVAFMKDRDEVLPNDAFSILQ